VFVSTLTKSGGIVGNVGTRAHTTDFFVFNGNYKHLTIPNVTNGGQLNGVNPAGNAVVGYYTPSPGITAGFLYQNKTLTTLQFPGSTYTRVFGINASGEVVGYFGDATTLHGFTWTPPGDAAKK
jgi:uncharacterized membrane protein